MVVNKKTEETLFKRFFISFEKFISSLPKKSSKEILKVIIEIILILVIVSLLKLPFILVRDLIINGLNVFDLKNIKSISYLIRIIFEIIYYIVAVVAFMKMFVNKYDLSKINKKK